MRLYRKPLKFEVEETGAKLDFVDKEIILGWDEVHIARKDPNKKFVMGTAAVPPKVRYPPYLGAAFVRKRKLKSWLMGTWFAETTADDEDRKKLGAIRVVAELQIQGFPNGLLKDVVASVQSQRVRGLRNVAQRYLSMAKHGAPVRRTPRKFGTTCLTCIDLWRCVGWWRRCVLASGTPGGRRNQQRDASALLLSS